MDRRRFLWSFTGSVLAVSRIALAQQAGKLPVVGVLVTDTRGSNFLPALDQGLREMGYVDGQNIVIKIGSAGGKPEAIPGIVAELVRLKVDVLIAVGPALARAAKEASPTVPIVAMDFESDPVQAGWARSLARPGGNLTGLFLNLPGLVGKWLELITDVAPRSRRVGVLWDVATGSVQLTAAQAAANQFAIDLHVMEFHSVDDVDGALASGMKAGMRSIVALSSPNVSRSSKKMADFARKNRLPAISPFRGFAEAGGLMSYGPNVAHFYRRAALYVDQIVKGAKPGELPIEQPTKFELVLNVGTAKTLGLAIPQSLRALVDEVIQ